MSYIKRSSLAHSKNGYCWLGITNKALNSHQTIFNMIGAQDYQPWARLWLSFHLSSENYKNGADWVVNLKMQSKDSCNAKQSHVSCIMALTSQIRCSLLLLDVNFCSPASIGKCATLPSSLIVTPEGVPQLMWCYMFRSNIRLFWPNDQSVKQVECTHVWF